MKERNPELHRKRVSESLTGLIGEKSRRWKGMSAGYVAKHMWISKHYGKANHCENDNNHKSWRFEWANLSGLYYRERSDYRQLCKKCHYALDAKKKCKWGHEYNIENTFVNANGWRECQTCRQLKKNVSHH